MDKPHDFNQIPFTPPGTTATISNPPETTSSWGPCDLNVWYISPEYHHYRCWEFYVSSTGGVQTYIQANFYPTDCEMPTENPTDEDMRMVLILTQAIMKLQNENRQKKGLHMEALQKLESIFKQAIGNSDANDSPVGQTTSTPTAPKSICASTITYVPKTRNITLGMLPAPIRSKRQTSEGDIPLSSEGGLSPNYEGEPNPHWYGNPQAKRARKTIIQTNKVKLRKTPISQPTINASVERLEIEKYIMGKM